MATFHTPEFRVEGARVAAIIGNRLPDPFVDRSCAELAFPRLAFNTARVSYQRNQLLPEIRRVRVPRSRREKHFPSSSEKCPSNRANSGPTC